MVRNPNWPQCAHFLTPQSDPSIKAILLKIDQENKHKFIMEDLDESTVYVYEQNLPEFKDLLDAMLRKTSMREGEEESSGDDEDEDDL